jgi:hypothetical protein
MRSIPYAEFAAFLETLGYVEKHVPEARVLEHPQEGLLVFRHYRDDEAVLPRDLLITGRFLDRRGVLSAVDYDLQFLRSTASA